jgi:hypothetical protein
VVISPDRVNVAQQKQSRFKKLTRLGFGREDLKTSKNIFRLVIFALDQIFAGDVVLSRNLWRVELGVVDSAGSGVNPTVCESNLTC